MEKSAFKVQATERENNTNKITVKIYIKSKEKEMMEGTIRKTQRQMEVNRIS